MGMTDIMHCPICGSKLRNIRLPDKHLFIIGKSSDYIERTCSKGMNHSLQFFTDEKTNRVDLIKFSLNHKYTKYIDIDFFNEKCRISCFKSGAVEYIEIPKLLEPDFPNLEKLKEKVDMYITIS